MRPLSLRASNYRGYAALDLDFRGVRSVVFAGDTGAGKSAIPGALLWALTGRNGSADSRGHVKLGTDLCQVDFVFEHAGSEYRIVRTTSLKTARGKSDLQFQVRNGDGWLPVGGKSIDETQAAIERLIGMGWEELTAGPFSRQDEAGRFVDPGEMRIEGKVYKGKSARLEVTKKMLGLADYAAWESTAKASARGADEQATALETQVANVETKLATRPVIAGALTAAETAIATCRTDQATTAAQIRQAEREIARLEAEIPRTKQDLAACADDRQALFSKTKTLNEKINRREHYHGLLARRAEIETQAAQATALDATLATKRQALAGIAAEGKAAADQVTAADRRRRETGETAAAAGAKCAEAQRKLADRPALEQRVARVAVARTERETCAARIRQTDDAITTQRAALDVLLAANQTATKRRGEILAEEQQTAAQKAGVEPQIAGYARRTAVMELVPCLGVDDLAQRCPLLQDARESVGPLADLRARHAALCAWVRPALPDLQPTTTLESDLRSLTAQKTQAQSALAALDRELAALQGAETDLARLQDVADRLPGLESDRTAADRAHAAAVTEVTHLAAIRDAKAADYRAVQAAIVVAEAERATRADAVRLLPELAHAETELPTLRGEIAGLEAEIAALQTALAKERDLTAWLAGSEKALAQFRSVQSDRERDLAELRSTEQAAIEAAARARQDLTALDALATEQVEARTEASSLRARHTTLVALCEAYRQIPIMILENIAVPVLAEEANRFLAKVSQNRMQVRIETQREIKTRDTLEDGLEIYIRDWRGERSIFDFSGGQRFELFLAFRIAWTRLQERRSGVGIEMLAIDEGFGSLSDGDLDAVMAALKGLEDEFDFLCVISHVERMREIFGCQVLVEGGDKDSTARMVLK